MSVQQNKRFVHSMLTRKLFRDMKSNAPQFISIFITILLGMLIFAGLNSISHGMDSSARQFYEETSLADAFLYGYNFNQEDIERLKENDIISDAELRFQTNACLTTNTAVTLQLNYIDSNRISSLYLIDGEPYSNELHGLWLDDAFAKANKYKIGDTISYTMDGIEQSEVIRGIIMHPEYIFAVKDESEALPNHAFFGCCFLSSTEYPNDNAIPYNQILLKTNASKQALMEYLSESGYSNSSVLLMRADHPSVNMFANEINQMRSVQTIFPVIFLLVAVLTILTTMTRITVNQRMQIGILKALGFSNRKILLHYSSFGFFLSLIGSILGTLLGIYLLPDLAYSFQKTFYILPYWNKEVKPFVFVVILLCNVCCGFCGFIACKKQLEGVAAKILRPKALKSGKTLLIEKSRWWLHRSFDFQWNLRDCMRNKIRSFITIFGIMGCMSLILSGLGMRDTIDDIVQKSYYELNTYETKVSLNDSLSQDTCLDIKNDPTNELIEETPIELFLDDSTETVNLTVLENGTYFNFHDISGYEVKLPDTGVLITRKTAQKLNLKEGDSIDFRCYGSTAHLRAKISAVIKNPISQGIYVSEHAYTAMNGTFVPTAFVTSQTDVALQEGFSTIQTKQDMIHTMDEIMGMMNVIISIMIIAAGTLGIVVLYNLGVLSFYEKQRELATLKVLGFQYHKLTKLLLKQNLWLTVLGILFGIPSGYLILKIMLQFMGDNFDLDVSSTFFSYLISILGTLLLSSFVNRFMSRKLKNIDMVSALKSTE